MMALDIAAKKTQDVAHHRTLMAILSRHVGKVEIFVMLHWVRNLPEVSGALGERDNDASTSR
jgi:hypothetical protein